MGDAVSTNRLIHETSPYLRQHAHNPVDWYPWGEEALRKAREEDRPIFLSVGYAACHWCHVMERESFEDAGIAAILNENFVSIKVDREERPDLDELYMNAVQALTGSGGWPMSVWLTPDLKPFFAGTYFPREERYGQPGFATVLTELARAYRERREEVEESAQSVAEALVEMAAVPTAAGAKPVDRGLIERAVRSLMRRFDAKSGGFGGAPKFPPSAGLALLLQEYEREQDPGLLHAVTLTLDRMARGGLYDQIGGGFHRYSTDARWLVPHFEKMLYDNALLVPVYLDAYRITGDTTYREIARETLAWVRREMTHPEGCFYSSLDADSEGEEGRFYLWTPDAVIAVLGAEDGALFNRIYGITPGGNFEGRSIPHLERPLVDWTLELGTDPDTLRTRLEGMRVRLREARATRVWPAKDDKVLTGWNGLMISAFARAAQVLGRKEYAADGERAADFLLTRLRVDGRLLHTYREGRAALPAYQDDYAFLARALLDLHAATGNQRWLDEARPLVEEMNDRFWDEDGGGFFFTARDQEMPIVRSKHPFDDVVPSGNSVAVEVMLTLLELGEAGEWETRIDATLAALGELARRAPEGFHRLLAAADRTLDWQERHASGAGTRLPDVVKIKAMLTEPGVSPGCDTRLTVRLLISPGWHINPHEPSEPHLLPTEVDIQPQSGLCVTQVCYPEPHPGEAPGEPEFYANAADITVDLAAALDAEPGETLLDVRVRYQPCGDGRCLAPVEEKLSVPLRILET